MSRFLQARDSIVGDSWLDDAARASLTAAAAKFDGVRQAFLAVDVSKDIDATVLAVVSKQMQDAVARMGKHLESPSANADRIQESDRERARLYPRQQMGRRIVFGFDSLDIIEPNLFGITEESPAERAAIELVNVLPSSVDDLSTIEAIPAHARALRNVIRDMVKAVEESAGVGLTIHSSTGGSTSSVLTRDQAQALNEELLDGTYQRDIVTVAGRLDGARTRRRIFYLETEDRDYEGVYDPDLAESVIRHIDKPVQAQIEMVRLVRNTGIAGRWSYRLLSLMDRPLDPGKPGEPGLFDS